MIEPMGNQFRIHGDLGALDGNGVVKDPLIVDFPWIPTRIGMTILDFICALLSSRLP
ncbi:MAG: hypothetical protein LBD06_13060 [Candidatus Accumulibacter sp.]|jgi:hypothetical protein|nr:hypothetical protein [Accumulibacter sp.]